MRFRTKVFALFLLLAILSSALVIAFMYWPTRSLIFGMMRTAVLSVAATAGAMVDEDALAQIKDRSDQGGEEYREVENQLRRARDANRRRDLYVKFIYSMRPYAKDPKLAEFVVDSEEEGPDKSNIGDIYKSENPNYAIHFNEPRADEDFVRDQWGTWLSATAPVKGERGDIIGTIGVDISAQEALDKLDRLVLCGAMAFGLSAIAAYILSSFAAHRISRPLLAIRAAVERVTAGDFGKKTELSSKDEFGEVAEAIDKMSLALQQREDLKNALARYVSEDILNEVIYAGKAGDLFSQRKKVTVLFADVRGFTSLSEQLSPEQTVGMLNDYFEKMIEAVFKNSGHLNKFMGDGLMALFGALRDDDFQEEHAIQAALDMRSALADLKRRWSESEEESRRELAGLRIGIGINTGLAIVGNIGSKKRMEFTAIGDSVNLASRLETATRDRDTDIIVSEYTFVAARSRFPFQPAGEIAVKGKSQTVRTYTISA